MRNIQKRRKKSPFFSVSPSAAASAPLIAALDPFLSAAVLAALLHEAGHLSAIFLCGRRIKSIRITSLGAEIALFPALSPYSEDIFIALAGVAANAAGALGAALFFPSVFGLAFSLCNLSLLAFNALPVRGLDGGEALRLALLSSRFFTHTEKVCRAASLAGIMLLWTVSVYFLFYRSDNFSLFFVSAYLFINAVWKEGGSRPREDNRD